MDVIIGATLADARKWRSHHSNSIPGLADAQLVSAHSHGWAHLNGVRVQRIYVAPGADSGLRFIQTLATARRNAAKAHGSTDPIYLNVDA